jgi:hypothetical protein
MLVTRRLSVVLQTTSDELTFTAKCLNLGGGCPGGVLEQFSVVNPAR